MKKMTDIDIESRNNQDSNRIEQIEKLHGMYYSSEESDRIKILQKLNYLNDTRNYDKIESYFISDENPEVRLEAAKVLAFNFKSHKAIKPILWVINNERDKSIKVAAVRLLVSIVDLNQDLREQIIKILKSLLKDRDFRLKLEAIDSLTILNEISIDETLIEFIHSDNRIVKNKAIRALGDLGSKKAVPYLLNNLAVDSFDVWKFTFNSLCKIISKDLPKMLIERLKELNNKTSSYSYKDGLFKKGIIKALGEIREDKKHEIFPILDTLNDKFYWVRQEARDALNKIDPNWKDKHKNYLKKNHLTHYL